MSVTRSNSSAIPIPRIPTWKSRIVPRSTRKREHLPLLLLKKAAGQGAQVYDLPTTGTFRFRQATESAFLVAVELRNIFLEHGSLSTFVVEAHLEFHVPETGILQSIELFIYALVCPT